MGGVGDVIVTGVGGVGDPRAGGGGGGGGGGAGFLVWVFIHLIQPSVV